MQMQHFQMQVQMHLPLNQILIITTLMMLMLMKTVRDG